MDRSSIVLTAEQQLLVENSLEFVHWTIANLIPKSNCRMEYDDLFQEGCVALCHAAASYHGGTSFKTYAITVIRNHLLDHCRRIAAHLKNVPTCSLDTPPCEDRPPPVREAEVAQDDSEQWVSAIYVAQLLEHGKRHYSGVAKLGVEALELKIKGYSGADIARLYHTKPNHVGAWIARAAEKFRQDAISRY